MTIKDLFNSYDENSLCYALEKLNSDFSYNFSLSEIKEKAKKLENSKENNLTLCFQYKIINKICDYSFSVKKNNEKTIKNLQNLTDEEYLLMSIENPNLIVDFQDFLLKTFIIKSICQQEINFIDLFDIDSNILKKENNMLGKFHIKSNEFIVFNIDHIGNLIKMPIKNILSGIWNFEIISTADGEKFHLYIEDFELAPNSSENIYLEKQTNFIGIIKKGYYLRYKKYLKNIYKNNKNNDLLLILFKHGFMSTIFTENILLNLKMFNKEIVDIEININ